MFLVKTYQIIGLNIQIDYPIDQVLDNVFFHKKVPFKWTYTKTEGNYYQAVYQLYRIKIYDKSLQYRQHFKMDKELLRVEINFQGVQLRRLYNLHTLEDLMNTPFSVFTKTLKSEVSSILFFDFTIRHASSRVQNYANKNYWQNLIDTNRSSTYEKHKRILKDYCENHSENVLSQLVNIIEAKSNELSFGGRAINDSSIDIITVPLEQERTCLVTGFGISMQKSNSRFLSSKGLEFYRAFNYQGFQSLQQRFASKKGKVKKISSKEMINQMVHNIRNKYHNNKGIINPSQLLLF